ncbi:MAG: hypothetical protein ACLTDI_13720 [Acutalibacteraceae bacterium]
MENQLVIASSSSVDYDNIDNATILINGKPLERSFMPNELITASSCELATELTAYDEKC